MDSEIEEETLHEFDALNTLLLCVLLALCILSSYMIKRAKFYYIPESAASLMVGLAVGAVARVINTSEAELNFLTFQPEMFFFLLLPPIIFEAGFKLRRKDFFRNFGTIVAFAVAGTLVSTFIVGFLTYALGRAGWVDIDSRDPLEALLFGSLISAVDPVATLSIMGSPELHCDPLLYSLVFGESVLNDAVAIVLFRVFLQYYYTNEELGGTEQILYAVVEFVGVSFGSVIVGVTTGLLCSFLFKNSRVKDQPTYEISLLFLFAYGAYALAEVMALSGIMALFFCGISLAHYNFYNLSEGSQVAAGVIFESMAQVAETFVFLYMGMGLFIGRFSNWSVTFVVGAILSCLVARVFNTFPISWAANLSRTVKIPMRMQFVMWFAGLRGAIAFALSQNMPGPNKAMYESTTLGVVIFTTVICGGLTEPVLRHMGMKRDGDLEVPDDSDKGKLAEGLTVGNVEKHMQPIALSRVHDLPNAGVHSWWKEVDESFMKPLFGGRL